MRYNQKSLVQILKFSPWMETVHQRGNYTERSRNLCWLEFQGSPMDGIHHVFLHIEKALTDDP